MSLGDEVASPENGAPAGANLSLTNPAAPTASDETTAQVQDILSSEIGINAMLNRLKQSIASAKEFANFLRRRSALEEEHANGLKKLCRLSQDGLQRADTRGGTFAKAYEDMMTIHERMADNGLQFAMSLHQMHEDLLELAAIAEKSRKGWKQNGLVAEQRVAELETAMRKSKAKYDSLAEEYDRARTGDTTHRQGGKMFGFKGKTGPQHEEDLLRKAQAADQDYMSKVQTVQTERGELLSKTRPETVKALQDIVKECDSGVVLQMQKFASFNEKLLLSNGLCVSPLKSSPDARSLRECILAIDNEKDFNEHIAAQDSRRPPRGPEPKYERNPLLDQSNRAQPTPYSQVQPQALPPIQPPQPQMFGGPGSRASTFMDSPISPPTQGPPMGHHYGQSTSSIPPMTVAGRPGSQPQHERAFSHGSVVSQGSPGGQQSFGGPRPGQQQPGPRFNGGGYNSAPSQGPPQLGALPFQPSPSQSQGPPLQQPQQPPQQLTLTYGQPPPQQANQPLTILQQSPTGPIGLPSSPAQGRRQATPPNLAPSRPVFGLSLSELYHRDGLAVPMVVYQCIQAVDLFGLAVEGIYRLSGSLPHVNKLKAQFDTDSAHLNLDFRNPENFFHDVNSVAGLLKLFFRDLPDPLLTNEHYSAFIEAAKNEDETVRRDSLHAIINSLPDPNYATLRALTLHLHRVMDNAGTNRMSPQNLAIVFGPTLMGAAGSNISDSGFQARVVETILLNTYQIFDDDD
ncbi:hypothetical protein B0T18DRAFT_406135 [Schizothecium vesticola]|uniref:RhoGAP-domain-containing protein n=1 Tax=Schizothecium vesticola TaxID=314040 RepID=A0AA40K7V7_9PEZI|nr:hypothetical protein B0T18DRAFT_406135 [Schizothecium vesticola]